MSATGDMGHVLPPNEDAAQLSWPQRIVKLEGEMATVYPQMVGKEEPDGTTRPGVLRRLETIETSIKELGSNVKHGGIAAAVVTAIAWTVQTFGLAEPIKHGVIYILGGKP